MTITEALGCDASVLEAMSLRDLEEHFGHMLISTRPEMQTSKRNKPNSALELKKQALLAELGLDEDDL